MIRTFNTIDDYNVFTANGEEMVSGDIYYILEDDSAHFVTNNIDGTLEDYNLSPTPSGNIEITENGENIDVFEYATATVAVPQPSGNVTLSENGEDIDIAEYATATVAVPQPSGNIEITQNGTDIDIADYATATVAVPQPSGNIAITQNTTTDPLDIAQYSTATVNVQAAAGLAESFTEAEWNAQQTSGFYLNDIITSITVPSGATQIGGCKDCSKLTTVNFPSPNTVTNFAENAFYRCSSLTSFDIPSGVTTLGLATFQYCDHMVTVTLPNTLTSLGGSGAFSRCTLLANVNLEDCTLLTTITKNCFYQCTSLQKITVPSAVTAIELSVFQNCSSLATVIMQPTIPPTIGNNVFVGTNANLVIYVPDNSVTAYQGASGWSAYSAQIQPISNYNPS